MGTKAIFVGGYTWTTEPSDVIDIYETTTSTWTTAKLAVVRFLPTAITVGNAVYFVGGNFVFDESSVTTDAIEKYTVEGGVQTVNRLSNTLTGVSAAAYGDAIFFAGGIESDFDITQNIDIYIHEANVITSSITVPLNSIASNIVDYLDTTTGVWTTVQLSTARERLQGVSIAGKMIFAGGYSNDGTGASSIVDIFDGDDFSWTNDSLPIPM